MASWENLHLPQPGRWCIPTQDSQIKPDQGDELTNLPNIKEALVVLGVISHYPLPSKKKTEMSVVVEGRGLWGGYKG